METRFGGHAESARVLSASPQTGERQQLDCKYSTYVSLNQLFVWAALRWGAGRCLGASSASADQATPGTSVRGQHSPAYRTVWNVYDLC